MKIKILGPNRHISLHFNIPVAHQYVAYRLNMTQDSLVWTERIIFPLTMNYEPSYSYIHPTSVSLRPYFPTRRPEPGFVVQKACPSLFND